MCTGAGYCFDFNDFPNFVEGFSREKKIVRGVHFLPIEKLVWHVFYKQTPFSSILPNRKVIVPFARIFFKNFSRITWYWGKPEKGRDMVGTHICSQTHSVFFHWLRYYSITWYDLDKIRCYFYHLGNLKNVKNMEEC